MRLIQVRVSDTSRESVLETLDDTDADYVIVDEAASNNASIVYFPVPSGAVKKMLDRLHAAGLEDDAFTIVTQIETATTPNFDELEGQYTQGPDDEIGLSHAELRTKAQELTPLLPAFVTFALLSAVVAASGLLLNSAIVIVGAMVISPFAGSSLSTAIGLVSDDRASVVESVRSQLLGLLVAISGAAGAGIVFKIGHFVAPTVSIGQLALVSSFTSPTLLTLTIAIFAGAAGALALATDLPVAVAGVAVAAAIIPASAAVGLSLVWGQSLLALGAFVLLIVNLVLINLTAFIALLSFGYRPSNLGGFSGGFSLDVRTLVSVVVAIALFVLIVGVFFAVYQYILFEQTVTRNVDDVLTDSKYARLELVEVRTEYSGTRLFGREGSVTVVVSRTSETRDSRLSDTLQQQIAEDTHRAVTVRVRFVDYQQTTPLRSGASIHAYAGEQSVA
jgi:uncharacterized hydrophobic protein (TIGR00271 family)